MSYARACASLFLFCSALPAASDHEECEKAIKQLQDRLQLVEETLQAVLRDRGTTIPATAPATPPAAEENPVRKSKIALPLRGREMPPELLPELGKVGAEVGLLLAGSSNPFHLDRGVQGAGFIDLPLFDRPQWLHGKVSYEILIGLSQSKTNFNTTSNVAQVANLAVLNTLNPLGGLGNVADAVAGTGAAPFPVTALTQTKLRLLQVVPFSFKYTSTALDRLRLRPYAVLGFGTYVTIHNQSPLGNTGVRTDANLPAAVLALVNQVYGGRAPFGGPLVAGQIAQSVELQSRGLPGGHGNVDFGLHTGAGFEYRVTNGFSVGIDSRWNRIAGAPGLLTTYGTRLGFHF